MIIYMIRKNATSCIYDSIYGGATNCMKGGSLSTIDMMTLFESKKGFLMKIFATLLIQLGITYYIMTNYKRENDKKKRIPANWILIIAVFSIILVLAIVPMNIYLKFGLFTIFSGITGILFSGLTKIVDTKIVKTAILGTISIFGVFFLLGTTLILSGIKLGMKTGLFLLFSLLLLIITMVVSYVIGNYNQNYRLMSWFGLVLFSAFIVYDTNKILQKDYYGDFVTASLDYYLDIINIFIRMLSFNRN